MIWKRAAVAALAASLAVPGAALAKSRKQVEAEARQKADAAKHERELGQAQAQHEKGTPSPLDDAQKAAIGEIVARNQLAAQAGALAAQQGKSAEVKNLGRWLADDHRRMTQDLDTLLRQRGADPAKLPPGPNPDRIRGELASLAKASGDDFDRQFVEFLTRNTPTLKEAYGRARDATPGSDADLKWYLDQGERLEIGHRDAARQLSEQRQARTPPPTQAAPRRPQGR